MLSLCACGGNPTANTTEPQQTTGSTEPTRDPNAPLCDGKTLKILAITSSFGLNTTQLLYDVAVAEGYDPEDVTVARLYTSGCTLKNYDEAMALLADLDEIAKENK